MFYLDNYVWKSTLIEAPGVGHAFSTRGGGVSRHPHTSSMNVGFGRGDDDDTVRKNIELLCGYADISYEGCVGSPQHHTSIVRYVTAENALEGIARDNFAPSDGFVTDCRGVSLIVRTADCTPILIVGEKADGSPVVGAAHAGWKGTVALIAKNLVDEACRAGALRESIKAAIGPCIGKCHFEVKDDFIASVTALRGTPFVERHVSHRDGKYFADMVSMNREILESAGVAPENIDTLGECTVCNGERYHSHRATGALRGTLGNVIGIK